jgi:hypothetical protein
MKFQINKVYKTKMDTPARILWVDSTSYQRYNPNSNPKLYVLHNAYTAKEMVLRHNLDGTFSTLLDYDLTDEEYTQEFKN